MFRWTDKNRNCSVMKNIVTNTSGNCSPDGALPACAHHYKVSVKFFRDTNDSLPWFVRVYTSNSTLNLKKGNRLIVV